MNRKCLRASAEARKGNSSFLVLSRQGEAAGQAGKGADACPYPEGDDRRDAWMFGFEDATT